MHDIPFMLQYDIKIAQNFRPSHVNVIINDVKMIWYPWAHGAQIRFYNRRLTKAAYMNTNAISLLENS